MPEVDGGTLVLHSWVVRASARNKTLRREGGNLMGAANVDRRLPLKNL
jgi:hypothetical protein